MSKSVQIPIELFMDLCKYHLFDLEDKCALEERICAGLERKLDAAAAREEYTKKVRQDRKSNP